jgi:hypothetical protein
VRYERSFSAAGAGRALIHGDWKAASTTFMNMPSKLAMQATWENDLALCLLESGQPSLAANYFKQALTLVPTLATRAVSAYYLEKLGGTVPPIPKDDEDVAAAKPETPAGEPKPETPADDARPAK